MPLDVYRPSRVPAVPKDPSSRALVDYLVRCRGLQEWRVVRVNVATLVGEVAEAIAYEFSNEPVLEQCHVFYLNQSLAFDMRVCGVPASAQFRPGEKPKTASGCLHFEMAFPRPPPLTPTLLDRLAGVSASKSARWQAAPNSARSAHSQGGRSILSNSQNSRWSGDIDLSTDLNESTTTISTKPIEANLLITIKLLGTEDEPRRMYVCDTDSVVSIREELGIPQERFTLCCDGRPVLNESSTFADLRITRKNVLSFKVGAARNIVPTRGSRSVVPSSARRAHLGDSETTFSRPVMSPSRAPSLRELAPPPADVSTFNSPITSPRGGSSTHWSVPTQQDYGSRRLPDPYMGPTTPSIVRNINFSTPTAYTPPPPRNPSASAISDVLSGSYTRSNASPPRPYASPPQSRPYSSFGPSAPLSPRGGSSPRDGPDKTSILFIDPDDLDFVHTVNVNPTRTVFGLFNFIDGGVDDYVMYCDGVEVRDPMQTFYRVTKGRDGCVFSFRRR